MEIFRLSHLLQIIHATSNQAHYITENAYPSILIRKNTLCGLKCYLVFSLPQRWWMDLLHAYHAYKEK